MLALERKWRLVNALIGAAGRAKAGHRFQQALAAKYQDCSLIRSLSANVRLVFCPFGSVNSHQTMILPFLSPNPMTFILCMPSFAMTVSLGCIIIHPTQT